MAATILPFPAVPRRHSPAVPPGHPVFRALLKALAAASGRDNAAELALLCRKGARDIRDFMARVAASDPAAVEHMFRHDLAIADLDDLAAYLTDRANELHPPAELVICEARETPFGLVMEALSFALFFGAWLVAAGAWSSWERVV